MKRRILIGAVLMPGLLLCGACVAFTLGAGKAIEMPQPTGTEVRVETLQKEGTDIALAVYPVVAENDANLAFGEAVGMALETGGLSNLRIGGPAFVPGAGTALNDVATQFGQHVRMHKVDGDYALWAEFEGTRAAGVQGVRLVLVTAAGEPVWIDHQKAGSKAFDHIDPANPMDCCTLAKERVLKILDIPLLKRQRVNNGPMQQLWDKKSGRPSQDTLKALKVQQKQLRKAGDAATVSVYPVQLYREIDEAQTQHLTEQLRDAGLFQVQRAADRPQFDVPPSSNEQKRLWDLARAFQTHLQANPPATDYALCVEYSLSTDPPGVWSVHTIVCDRKGEWAVVDFQNNHHKDFQRIDPKNKNDCDTLVVARLKGIVK